MATASTHAGTAHVTGTAPMLLVRDVAAASAYYRDALGFTLVGSTPDAPTFVLLRRDAGAIMLSRADDPAVVVPNWTVQSKTSNVYFWVDDAAALYEEYRRSGARIDWDLHDTPWGSREFGVQDLDGYDIAFAQHL